MALTPASAAAQTWQTLIDDEFIGPDGSNLATHVPETNVPGGTWSLGGAPYLMLQAQAVRPSDSGPFDAYATIDARVLDGDIGQYWYAVPSGDNSQVAGGLVFRYVSSTNYMLVHYFQERVWLWKMTPGGFVHIAYADVAPPYNAYHWMAVRAIGSSLAVNWDGVDVIQVSDSTNLAATRHGVWFRSVGDYRSFIGTFRVRSQQAMQPPAVASIATTPDPLNLPIASATVVAATGYSPSSVAVPTATFTWASSNPAVAWIQSTTQNTAKIVASTVGTAQLTVTAHSGPSTFSKTIPVTVTNTTAQVKQVLINDDFIDPEGSGLASHWPETNLSQGSWSLGGSPSETKELALTVQLSGLIDQGYTVGQPLLYEVQLINDSGSTVIVPWSTDPALAEQSGPTDLSAQLSLLISNDGVKWHNLTAVSMLGNADVPSTVNSLAPGATSRIRASGQWIAPGVNIRHFLAASNGRVSVRAVYRMRSGTTLASTEPSSPVSVTCRR